MQNTFFPNIEELAVKDIVTIPDSTTLRHALSEMATRNIRDVIVSNEPERSYRLLTINDIIRLHISSQSLEHPISDVECLPLPTVTAGVTVLDAMKHFSRHMEYLGVVDDAGKLMGLVSYSDITNAIDPQLIIEHQSVGDLVLQHTAKVVSPGAPLSDVFSLLHEPSDAVIVHQEEKAIGILTTKDAIRLIHEGVSLSSPVEYHMSSPVESISAKTSVKEALNYLQDKHFKRVVIHHENGHLLGVVSQQSLVSMAYSRWAELMRNHQEELTELVELLKKENTQFEQIAIIDRLTGIYNRTKFDELIEYEIARTGRYGENTFTLLLIDIDHFKSVNDTWGHLEGDKALKQVARVLSSAIRSSDTVARWGGEEFVALLANTPQEQAMIFAERLRQSVEATNFDIERTITISIGIAEYNRGEEQSELFARADKALYRAKELGRNRVEFAS